MPETLLDFKSCLSAAQTYDLITEDEIEIKVNGTMILKEQVPNGKMWRTHISVHVEEEIA